MSRQRPQSLASQGPIQVAGLDVEGTSIGGIETCIELPRWKLAFDVGRSPLSAVRRRTVLFTHAHMDHMGGVAIHAATRGLLGMPTPIYVVPRENVADFEALFEVWRRLDRSELNYELVPLGPAEEWILPNKRIVRPFRAAHRVATQGYGLWERRRKLRPELATLTPREIRDRRKSGEAVTHDTEVCQVAFCGDTRIEVIEREEVARTARLLILECTFVDDRVSVDQSRSKGHTHLFEIAERAELFANEAILLTHFSSRYRARDIVRALDERLPAELRERVTPLLSGH